MARGVEVGGEVVHVAPVAQDRALDVDDVRPVPVAAPLQLAEHHREHRAADRGWRVDREVPLADRAAHRRAHERGVLGEVEVGDEATVGRHVVDHRPADLAGGEHRGPSLATRASTSARRGWCRRRRLRRADPSGAGDDAEGVGVATEQRVRHVDQVAGSGAPHGVAVRGRPPPAARRRRPTAAGPSASTASWQAVTAPGVATEPWPAEHPHAAAVVGDDLVHAARRTAPGRGRDPASRRCRR